jgi:uracil phosphoribosyltransferase
LLLELCARRAGDSLLDAVRRIAPEAIVGKILIQRDESTPDKRAIMMYRKLPHNIAQMQVLLCDPMLVSSLNTKLHVFEQRLAKLCKHLLRIPSSAITASVEIAHKHLPDRSYIVV